MTFADTLFLHILRELGAGEEVAFLYVPMTDFQLHPQGLQGTKEGLG